MKLVKSDRRTLLKESTLSDCLMIKLQGESIKDFNSDKAINVWFEKLDRRLGSSGSQENRKG